MRTALILLFLTASFVAPCALPAQLVKLYPKDEAVRQPDFFTFRARLVQAAGAADAAALDSVLAEDILNSFGGDGGPDEFRAMWRPQDPESPLWPELTRILTLGGSFYQDSLFIAPYTSSDFPDTLDSFEHVVIVGSEVRVRQAPDPSAAILATLSFDVVRRAEHASGATPPGWVPVQLASGETGYLWEAFVGSATGRRAVFVRRDGRWLLRALVAGD